MRLYPFAPVAGVIILPALFSPRVTWPIPGDTLYVGSEFAVVREAPNVAAAPVARIHEGQAVVEIQRRGTWCHIGVVGAGITGWIHLSFLKDPDGARTRSQPLIPPMRRFRPVFDAFNAMNATGGAKPFLSVSERADGLLWVNASAAWWSSPFARRKEDLMSLYQMWKVANEQLPVTVVITDPEGRRQLEYPAGSAGP